jgi:hypothetical protein
MATNTEDTSAPDTSAPGSVGSEATGNTITAAKFKQLIDTIDTYMQHSHTFSDDYRSNCQCQCGRGSI